MQITWVYPLHLILVQILVLNYLDIALCLLHVVVIKQVILKRNFVISQCTLIMKRWCISRIISLLYSNFVLLLKIFFIILRKFLELKWLQIVIVHGDLWTEITGHGGDVRIHARDIWYIHVWSIRLIVMDSIYAILNKRWANGIHKLLRWIIYVIILDRWIHLIVKSINCLRSCQPINWSCNWSIRLMSNFIRHSSCRWPNIICIHDKLILISLLNIGINIDVIIIGKITIHFLRIYIYIIYLHFLRSVMH